MELFRIIFFALFGTSFSTLNLTDDTTSGDNKLTSKEEMTSSTTFKLPPLGRPMREEFLLDPNFIQLNHGSYGSYPKSVEAALHSFQRRAEANPESWMRRELEVELAKIRGLLATYLNTDDADDLVIVPNTTGGMNAIFRSLPFQAGEKILHFSTVYDAMRSVIKYVVDNSQGQVSSLEFNVTYPISNEELLTNFSTFLDTNHSPTSPIRIALVDHITSVPGVVNPIQQIIPLLKSKNILVLIDGAHAIGHVPIDLNALDVDFYITNCHKWLYTVRGTAVMYVKKEHQHLIHPASISNSYAVPSNFQKEFFWTGTLDFSSYLTVTASLEFRNAIGEDLLRNYTHSLAVEGGALVASALGTRLLQTGEEQIGNMVDVEVPIDDPNDPEVLDPNFWINTLLDRFNMYVATYKHNGKIWLRLSAQIYNDLSDFERAAEVFNIICNEINQKSVPKDKCSLR